MRDWSEFEGLAGAITASGRFRSIERAWLTFTHRNGTAIDLLPHGDIANRGRRSSPSAATRCRRRPTSGACLPGRRRSRPPGARCASSPAPRSARTSGVRSSAQRGTGAAASPEHPYTQRPVRCSGTNRGSRSSWPSISRSLTRPSRARPTASRRSCGTPPPSRPRTPRRVERLRPSPSSRMAPRPAAATHAQRHVS